jgi:hypothetical protein
MRHKAVQHHLNGADILKVVGKTWEDGHHSGCVCRLLTDVKIQSSECLYVFRSTFDNMRNGRRHVSQF